MKWCLRSLDKSASSLIWEICVRAGVMCRCRNVNEFFSLGSQIWFTVYRIFVLSLVRFPNWKTLISDKVIRFPLFNRSSSIKFEMMFATIKSNYKKLLVIALTSSRTSSYIKHDFFTISLHSSCKCCCFSCFEASSNENSMGKKVTSFASVSNWQSMLGRIRFQKSSFEDFWKRTLLKERRHFGRNRMV